MYDYARKMVDGAKNVSNSVRKMPDGVRKLSAGDRKVLYNETMFVHFYYFDVTCALKVWRHDHGLPFRQRPC